MKFSLTFMRTEGHFQHLSELSVALAEKLLYVADFTSVDTGLGQRSPISLCLDVSPPSVNHLHELVPLPDGELE